MNKWILLLCCFTTLPVWADTNLRTSDQKPVEQSQPDEDPSKRALPNNKLGRLVGKVEDGSKRVFKKVEDGAQHVGEKVSKFGEKVGQKVEQKTDKVKSKVNEWVGDDKKAPATIEEAKPAKPAKPE